MAAQRQARGLVGRLGGKDKTRDEEGTTTAQHREGVDEAIPRAARSAVLRDQGTVYKVRYSNLLEP